MKNAFAGSIPAISHIRNPMIGSILKHLKGLAPVLLGLVSVSQAMSSEVNDSILLRKSSIRIDKYLPDGTLKSSGDGQHDRVGHRVQMPFVVQVTDTLGQPVKGVRVYFEITKTPEGANNSMLDRIMLFTNSQGLAQTHLQLGDKPGEYQVAAKIVSNNLLSFTLFTAYARPSNWVLMLFVGLAGGLALFFLGIRQMSDGLRHGTADRLRNLLLRMSKNRYVATAFGALVTIITQSSSATTVMLVGFVQSGLLKFHQTVGMIFGAAIGTTITVQLISFKLSDYSLLIVAVGFTLMYLSKREGIRSTGETLLGFGILFYGMHLMSGAMTPLKSYEPFVNVLVELQKPLLGVLVGAISTAIIQSSAAFIGIVLTLSTQGLISLEGSIPLLMGANLGTSITGIIAAFSASREAKKVALAYTVFKVIGILLLFWIIQPFADLVRWVTPDSIDAAGSGQVMNLPHQIANAHTVYNVLLALVVLPFTSHFAKLIDWLMPTFAEEKPLYSTRFIDENLLSTPSVAINLAKQEVVDMGRLVQGMVDDVLIPFTVKDIVPLTRIEKAEQQVNYLCDQINGYLIKITRRDIGRSQIQQAFQVMYAVKEFEQVGDLVSKNLAEKARWWINAGYEFSPEGKQELMEFHHLTQKQLRRALEVFENLDLEMARKTLKKYEHYKETGIELEHHHFERLKQDIDKSVTSSKTHLELVSVFRTIGSHANNIARIILEWPGQR